MTAVLQDGFDRDVSKNWRTGRTPRPSPGHGQVLVEVRAAAMDRGTWHLSNGAPWVARLAWGVPRPSVLVPGRDLSGVVVEVGGGVDRFAVGDEVYGTAQGSFAEYAVASSRRLAPKPTNLDFIGAAAVPVSGLAALQGLVDVGGIQPGWSVLINGASGGVGTWAVQIAAAMGATVTARCSASKADLVRSLGATHVLDRHRDDVAASSGRFDLVFDLGGRTPVRQLRSWLTPRGTLVVGGGEQGRVIGIGRALRAAALSPFVRQRLRMLVSRERHEDLERLTEMLEAGSIEPVVDSVHGFDDAVAAMERLVSGEVRGKVVLVAPSERGGHR
jgi:NADPH:quinone reductase-like Zn-dependent oxidoreductase